jgi:hypothetical protein
LRITASQISRALAARVRSLSERPQARSLAVSLLLHLALVLLGGSAVLVHQSFEMSGFTAESSAGLVADDLSASAPPPSTTPAPVFQPSTPAALSSIEMLVTNALTPNAFRAQPFAEKPKPLPDPATPVRNPPGLSTEFLPATMAGRTGAEARRAALLRMGGSDRTEGGAMAGLRWLKRAQNRDGSWGKSLAPALTGLTLLCFLGHGELPDSPEFGPAVERGIEWLLVRGSAYRGRLSMQRYFDQRGVYEHAIATYALAEYYTMTRDERVKILLTYAAAYIVQGQAADGGWQYSYSKAGASDTSVTGWQIQALKATYLAGLTQLGVEQALDRSTANLQRVRSADGAFGYRKAGDRDGYGLTGVGALCAYLRWSKPDPMLTEGVRYIIERTESDRPIQYRGPTASLYAWYYHTQACLMAGGEAWEKWNGWIQKELLENQSADGSFPPTGNPRPHGPEIEPSLTGQIYRTSLCVLMLESYYRHLPSSR